MWKQYCVEKFYKKKPQFASAVIPTAPRLDLGHNLLDQVGCIKAIDAPKARDYLRYRKIPSHKWDELYYIENCQALSGLDYKYKERVFGNDPRLVHCTADDINDPLNVPGCSYEGVSTGYEMILNAEIKLLKY